MNTRFQRILLCGAASAFTALITVAAISVPAEASESPAPHNASGCNGDTCINVQGGPLAWAASGKGDGFYGHIQLLFPDNSHPNGTDSLNPSLTMTGKGAGKVCAIGWKKIHDNFYVKVGEPCITVS